MVRRPALGGEDARHGLGVLGIGAKPVDRFRRKGDELAGLEQADGLIQFSRRGHA
ncbi:hypothetical protein D3C81_1906160 [compost metagenome]